MNIKDNEGHTPMDIAKNNDKEECVEIVLKAQEEPRLEENSMEDGEKKASKNEDSIQLVSVDVHETETEPAIKEEDSCSNPMSEDTNQENQRKENTDTTVDEEELSNTPAPRPKKKRRVSFQLEGEEPENTEREKSSEHVIPEIEDNDEDKKQSAEDQISQVTVSNN